MASPILPAGLVLGSLSLIAQVKPELDQVVSAVIPPVIGFKKTPLVES